jgi:DNA-binding IclR family transcriptional regulator
MTQLLQTPRVKEALSRVRNLFVDPGAMLTTTGAAKMAGLDRQVCRVLLRNLVESGFLEQRPVPPRSHAQISFRRRSS